MRHEFGTENGVLFWTGGYREDGLSQQPLKCKTFVPYNMVAVVVEKACIPIFELACTKATKFN